MLKKFSALKNMIAKGIRQELLLKRLNANFPSCQFAQNIILKGEFQNLELGENVTIQDFSILHLGGMDWCENAGRIKIGSNSIISPNCTLYGTGPYGIEIGDYFGAGMGVVIVSSVQDYVTGLDGHVFKPVRIGNRVTIASNSVVSAGVTIGDNSYIGAGSVVLSDIPSGVFAAGAPAKVIKELTIKPKE